MMNNKKLGTAFEQRICDKLKNAGYWVHFLTPDKRGAQPFDIIAVKDGLAVAIECKTLDVTQRYFRISRLEENQKLALERWKACGNNYAYIVVEYGKTIVPIRYEELLESEKIDLWAKVSDASMMLYDESMWC